MTGKAAAKCPLCGKPTDHGFRPFCSNRCADLDLNQWFKGGYAVPGAPLTPGQTDENEPDED